MSPPTGPESRRDEAAHQEARNGGVAVGKMELVRAASRRIARGAEPHMRRRARCEAKPVEARNPYGHTSSALTGVDPDPPLAMRPGLEDGHHALVNLGAIHQESR